MEITKNDNHDGGKNAPEYNWEWLRKTEAYHNHEAMAEVDLSMNCKASYTIWKIHPTHQRTVLTS